MGTRRTVLAAAGAASLALVAWSPPAHAAAPIEDRTQVDVSFTYHGSPLTCTLVGETTYVLQRFPPPGNEYVSVMSSRTTLVDTEARCFEA